jgi:ABC-2 type transport system permease protein
MPIIVESAPNRPAAGYTENAPRVLLPQTVVMTKRLLVRWSRDLTTVIETLVVPVVLLLAFNTVLGKQIESLTGHSALFGSVPMVTVLATISGSSVNAMALVRERADGLLARMWALPVHRAAGLLSRFLAEAVRILVTTLVILVAAVALGFRFEQGPLAAVVWLAVPVVLGLAFATLVTAAAFYSATTTLVEAISLVNTLGIFFCTGFVPADQYPEWVRPLVEHQPMSYAIEAMRGLSQGGPVLSPILGTCAWAGGIVAVCVVPMVKGYRKASMR